MGYSAPSIRILSVLIVTLLLGSVSAKESGERGTYSGAKPTEYPSWFKESFLEFEADIAEAKASGKRLMVVFHQDGCPYCNELVEKNLSQKDIEETIKKNFDVVAMNIWGDREVISVGGQQYTEKTFAESLKVQFTPTILFFDEQGKVVLRLNGYLPPRNFKVALDWVATHGEKTIAYREYVAKNLPAGGSGGLHSQDFFQSPPLDLSKNITKQPLAVFFEQSDCPNCNTLHKKVLIDTDTRKVIKNFTNVQLDMWSDTSIVTPTGEKTTARAWANKLNIKYAPTIVLFNKEGNEIIRSEAVFKVFHVQGIFAYVLTGSYREQPNFQRYLSARAEHFVEEGKDVDIWSYADKPAEKKKP